MLLIWDHRWQLIKWAIQFCCKGHQKLTSQSENKTKRTHLPTAVATLFCHNLTFIVHTHNKDISSYNPIPKLIKCMRKWMCSCAPDPSQMQWDYVLLLSVHSGNGLSFFFGLPQILKPLLLISQRHSYTSWTSCLLSVNSDLIPCAGETQSESSHPVT